MVGETGKVHYIGSNQDAEIISCGHSYLLEADRLKHISYDEVQQAAYELQWENIHFQQEVLRYNVLLGQKDDSIVDIAYSLLFPGGTAYDFHNAVEF